MTLEQQVISLSLAKRLKELGVKQESVWYWQDSPNSTAFNGLCMEDSEAWDDDSEHVAAFTVAELGEMLPEDIEVNEESYWIGFNRGLEQSWQVFYRLNGTDATRHIVNAANEAEARGLMLEYLITNNLITL